MYLDGCFTAETQRMQSGRREFQINPKQLSSIARACSAIRWKGANAEAVSLPHVLAGNSVSLKVIEAWRANVRKLIQKMLDRICGVVLYKTIRAAVMSRAVRKKFQ
jgi:hypothetical protein